MTRRLVAICVPATFLLLLIAYFKDDTYHDVMSKTEYLSPKRNYVSALIDEKRFEIDNRNVAFKQYQSELQNGRAQKQRSSRRGETIGKIWVSMSVCFSENTQLYEKKNYPYAAVTPLATLLWNHFVPDKIPFGVIVQVVYAKEKTFMNVLEGYTATLREAGAIVRLVAADEGADCPLQSQLVRLFAFEEPEVQDGDVVITMDVNAFVVAKKVFNPILENPGLLAWVYQYHDTAHIRSGKGETFNQNLIAMRASTWKKVLGVSNHPGKVNFKQWLDERKDTIGLDRNHTWYYDQWITTHGLLKNKLCNAPSYSGLWTAKGLEFDPNFDDSEVCFHGFGYKDCNKNIHIVYEGCKWWHFYPDQTFEEHIKKFHEITKHQYELRITNPYQSAP